MNKKETATLMAILKVAYPQYYSRQDEVITAVNLWADMFKDDDFQLVSAAIKSFIASDVKGFPPSIGAIKAYITKITSPDEITEQEAWSIIKKALSNSAYNSKDEFARLPPEIQRLVGAPSQLKEWATIDISQLDTVVASNFMRSYKCRIKSIKEFQALPNEVKQFIGKIGGNMSLELPDTEQLKADALKALEVAGD